MAAETIHDFRDLRVWQDAVTLVERIYGLSKCFPKNELYGLQSQIQRAAVSIPSNIAEGHERGHLGEYIQFLHIARGSLAEFETQVIIANRLKYVDQPTLEQFVADITTPRRRLNALISALERRLPPGRSEKSRTQNPKPRTP
ncbi:four helix bundle protein [soil metagenome]